MSHDQHSRNSSRHKGMPAPCIVDAGIVINKQDMQRLLMDLNRVRYSYWCDEHLTSEGEGIVLEVFADARRSTLVANNTLYLNVYSFDYLELKKTPQNAACFELVQESLRLQLVPLSNPLKEQANRTLDTAALEAVVAEVLSASWDVQLDDDENLPL